ncbi:MAG: HAD-IIB family hydrolase, partial [Oscillochloris sp.]|nr:HAD-IIB family hydrolase [Oscillochloris sp.]
VLASLDTSHIITQQRLSPSLLATVTTMLTERGMPYTVFGPDTLYTPLGQAEFGILESYGEPSAVALPYAELLQVPNPIKVLTFLAPGPLDTELAELMGDHFEAIRTGPQFFEFLPPGISKGSALDELMTRYEVPRDEVLVIGDGENDISMFGVAGLSIVMEGAPAAVKAHATISTAHCDADGVALALHQHVLM